MVVFHSRNQRHHFCDDLLTHERYNLQVTSIWCLGKRIQCAHKRATHIGVIQLFIRCYRVADAHILTYDTLHLSTPGCSKDVLSGFWNESTLFTQCWLNLCLSEGLYELAAMLLHFTSCQLELSAGRHDCTALHGMQTSTLIHVNAFVGSTICWLERSFLKDLS